MSQKLKNSATIIAGQVAINIWRKYFGVGKSGQTLKGSRIPFLRKSPMLFCISWPEDGDQAQLS